MKSTILSVAKMLVFLAVGITILWFLYHDLNSKYISDCLLRGIPEEDCSLIDKVIQDLKSTKAFWLVVICVCFLISNLSRASRWKQLLDSLGYQSRWQNSFHCVMLGYFANLGFPRIGEVVRAGTFSRYEDIPFEKVVGTVAVDRIVDMACFLTVFFITLLLQYDLLWSYISDNAVVDFTAILQNRFMLLGIGFSVLTLFLIYHFRRKLAQFTLYIKVRKLVAGFAEGLQSLAKVRNKPIFIFHTIVIWSMYFLMTYLCFKSFQPTAHLGLMAGLMIFVFGSLGMIIPTPGGMGSYHALVMAGLALYGVDQNDAFSFAMIIFFTINIFGNILFGIIALFLLPGYNRGYQPARA